jgi:DNA-binding transcriptional LysR family regulator
MEYLNLNRLRHFYNVAETGSYTKAATKMHIQQPALSKTIKSLEEDLGIKLFDKAGRGVKLTSRGSEVFEHCHKIFGHVRALSEYTKEESVLLNKTLYMVSDDAVSAFILPEVLNSMHFKEKALRPIIATGPVDDLMTKLSYKKAEIGFFFYTPKMSDDLSIIARIPIEFKLVVSKFFANSPEVISSFIGSREINDTNNNKFPTIKKMQKIWPETKSIMSSNSFLTHKELVLKGLGVSLLPQFLVRKELENGKLTTILNEETFVYDLKVVVRSENKNSELLSEIARSVEEHAVYL